MIRKRNDLPDDDTGDALRRLQHDGDSLTWARDIDFSVVFPNANAAEQFAKHSRELGHKAKVENNNCVPELPWDVNVVDYIVPSYAEITAFEDSLQMVVDTFGGRNNGWGCFTEKDHQVE